MSLPLSAEPPAPPTKTTVALTLLIYCISGTLLTLANKLAVVAFPFPNTLLVIQNGITLILLLIGSVLKPSVFQKMPRLTFTIVKTWGPLVAMFVVMLFSSLQALAYVSATAVIVIRNLSTLVVAFFEGAMLGERIKMLTWLSLVMIFIGAVIFGARDLTFNAVGYAWLCLNVLATSCYQIYVKKLIVQSKELGPFGMAYINNALSIPVFLSLSVYNAEGSSVIGGLTASIYTTGIVLLSALLGFTLSTSAFMINRMITATSMMVANNVNKFAVILLSELFVERTLDNISSLGTLIVMFFGWFYSKTKTSDLDVLLADLLNKCKRKPNEMNQMEINDETKLIEKKAAVMNSPKA